MTEITATRQSARELDDGTLEVVMHVHAQCKSAFFEAFPKPSAWAVLTAKAKPPTQGAAPIGTDEGTIMSPTMPENSEAMKLADHPYFQAYAVAATKLSGDNKQIAVAHISKSIRGIGGLVSQEAFQTLVADYHAFCATKGWNPNE